MNREPLFEQVVQASRLNELIAPFTVSRLLTRADLVPARLTPDQLTEALPELERGLRVYLDAEDLEAAMTELRELAA